VAIGLALGAWIAEPSARTLTPSKEPDAPGVNRSDPAEPASCSQASIPEQGTQAIGD